MYAAPVLTALKFKLKINVDLYSVKTNRRPL